MIYCIEFFGHFSFVLCGLITTVDSIHYLNSYSCFFWYKQTLGQRPKLISSFYVYDTKITFHNEFKNNQRFTLERKHGTNNLNIDDVIISDSATYYCATSYTFVLSFAEGTTLNVQDSASEIIQPGGSVTLNCTVHTGSCDGEHSVYWFKDSEESHPGIIYTHGDRNDQCERKPDTQTNTCIYNLPMENLNVSHAGTYYCAVASCGHILFGNGTKLDFEGDFICFSLVINAVSLWENSGVFKAEATSISAVSLLFTRNLTSDIAQLSEMFHQV
uniref:Ig-like domain-containing protein n=1 Tax=Anabas testudineus TaxID=64144 RepID=A0A3Q1J8D0_ANATE